MRGHPRTAIVLGLALCSASVRLVANGPPRGAAAQMDTPQAPTYPVLKAPEGGPTTAASAQSFIDSVGVNTHVTYHNRGYGNVRLVIRSLRFLGVRHVRDRAPVGQELWKYRELATAGVKFDLVISGRAGELATELPTELGAIRALMRGS